MLKKCLNCNEDFKIYPSEKNKKFCSKECSLNFKKRIVYCAVCNNEIKASPSTMKHKKYCSKKCRDTVFYIEKSCIVCNKKFKVQKCYEKVKTLKIKCCSIKCKKEYKKSILKNKRHICLNCGIEFFAYRSNKTKQTFCSQDCSKKYMRGEHHHSFGNGYTINSDGYRYLKIGNKYVLEHRIIMEAYLNRKLKRNETIHHKDMNKLNNDISNLEVLSRAEHSRLHSKLKKKEKGVLNEKDSSSSL